MKNNKLFCLLAFCVGLMCCDLLANQGAGILPYCRKDGRTYFLFRYDSQSAHGVWGDFGGDFDAGQDENWRKDCLTRFKMTAARCASEITNDFFINYLRNNYPSLNSDREFFCNHLMGSDSEKYIVYLHAHGYRYALFFVEIPYIPTDELLLSGNFDAQRAFNDCNKFYHFVWIDYRELFNKLINQRTDEVEPLKDDFANRVASSNNRFAGLETDDAETVLSQLTYLNGIKLNHYIIEELNQAFGKREILRKIIRLDLNSE